MGLKERKEKENMGVLGRIIENKRTLLQTIHKRKGIWIGYVITARGKRILTTERAVEEEKWRDQK